MTDNIIPFTGMTRHDLDAAHVLRAIAEEKPKFVFVICWPVGDKEPTYHTNTSDIAAVLMRLDEFKHKYFSGEFL